MTHFRNPGIYFLARQLAAFAGFRALSHLDLKFLGFDEVKAGHTETARRNLLDGAVFGVAVRQGMVALRIFTALAGVALCTNPVHRDSQRFMRFLADRAVAHRAGLEALHDALDRFDFLDGHRLYFFEVEQAAQRAPVPVLLVYERRILFESLVIAGANSVLELVNRLRIEQMI